MRSRAVQRDQDWLPLGDGTVIQRNVEAPA